VSESVGSLRHQTAGEWDACVVASPDEIAPLRTALERAGSDGRVTLRATSEAVAPAAALADAVASTSAELVTWLDAGDRLDRVALRVGERARRVAHVAEVLYPRRRPSLGTTPARAPAAAMRAVAEHLDRIGLPATVEHDFERPRLLRLRPARTARPPVSIVIPT